MILFSELDPGHVFYLGGYWYQKIEQCRTIKNTFNAVNLDLETLECFKPSCVVEA